MQKKLLPQQDYTIQLSILERNNTERLFMAWQEQQRHGTFPNLSDQTEQDEPNIWRTETMKWTLQDYQMKKMWVDQKNYEIEMMLLEQKNRKRLLTAWEEHTKDTLGGQTEKTQNPTPTLNSSIQNNKCDSTSQDQDQLQMRLMLLEYENKKRLMMTRGESRAPDASSNLASQAEQKTQNLNLGTTTNRTIYDYQMQVLLLEQQKNKRMADFRQQQANVE
ncbi:hypothetical protein UA08_01521 [Talaromyces atroroseus]|uniref:Uncharacterized protein n=1 Tax=Talaromyces atroroseus TaxID=1441469 RepID=A0A1Q5QCE4_TALAT|nr:hypothetical protein UA08_01521 [Talaromyces atroroseus]OKL63551.1 hypothetical protein UA08_01521 [Talaromyces atroroseus]